MVITLLFILLLVSGLAFLFLKKRNKKIKISNPLNNDSQNYYMFNLDDYNFLIYVTSTEKMQEDKIQSIKYTIIEKLNITKDVSNEIGVSYLGYISETEFKSKN